MVAAAQYHAVLSKATTRPGVRYIPVGILIRTYEHYDLKGR